jgi:hypothetical protein
MLEKLKSYLDTDHIFYGILIFMVGIVSFWCGRLSFELQREEPVVANDINFAEPTALESVDEITPKPNTPSSVSGEVVASRSGTKYHLLNCPGAKTIKPENMISFVSVEEAEAAGYKRAQNCP